MTGLPASVEAYLQEAGFSQTEILILKRLIEGEAMTLRELAAKTGKSTGVLDQATKKLLGKKILSKEQINDGLKYTLGSVQAITTWVQKDMQEKKDNLQRKHQNFETFISSITVDRNRPDMEYFEGEEGIKKAYLKLLEMGCKEFLQYFPVEHKEEEDPLCAFRVQYFRERRKRGIFSRVITHDTLLGRRFQSRDVFEYRKTVLVPEDRCPFQFEQIICCNTVACFDHKEQKVCFIKFAQLAEAERKFFEAVWQHPAESPNPNPSTEEQIEEAQEIPVQTRTLSGLREFFLSRKSIVTFAMLAVLSGAMTFGLYKQNANLATQRIREKVTSIAATGALQFTAEQMNEIHVIEDSAKPIYGELVKRLDEIRKQNDQIIYVYLMRPLGEDTYEFIADADAPDPYAKIDTNNDGLIDEADQLGVPGLEYDISNKDALMKGVPNNPVANKEPYTDSWGSFFTGYAPIKDSQGKTIAVLAVDMWASKVEEFTEESFTPLYYFLGFFIFFILIRLSAFNRSLAKDIVNVFKSKQVLSFLGLCTIFALITTYAMYRYTFYLLKEETGSRLAAIVSTAAPQIDANDLINLRTASDMRTAEYQKVFEHLNRIRDQNENVTWVYVMRPTDTRGLWEFVVDADSNYNLPEWNDYNNNGVREESEENVSPGVLYDVHGTPGLENGIPESSIFDNFTVDQWGVHMSGYAPIRNHDGESVAIVGVDMEISELHQMMRKKFTARMWFSGVLTLIVLMRLIQMHRQQKFKSLSLRKKIEI